MQPEMCCVRVSIPGTIGQPGGWIFSDSIKSCILCGLLLMSSMERLVVLSLIILGSFHSQHLHPRYSRGIQTASCDNSNLVYLLFCHKCEKGKYAEETGTKFRLRFNNHRTNIRGNNNNQVSVHFNQPSHSIDDVGCMLLASWFGSRKHRRRS